MPTIDTAETGSGERATISAGEKLCIPLSAALFVNGTLSADATKWTASIVSQTLTAVRSAAHR